MLHKGKEKKKKNLGGEQVKPLPSVHDWNPEPPTVFVEDVYLCSSAKAARENEQKWLKS